MYRFTMLRCLLHHSTIQHRLVAAITSFNQPRDMYGPMARARTCRSPGASAFSSSAHDDRPPFADMRHGRKLANIFSKDEFERRLTDLRRHMSDNDIGGIVFTSFHNINYYSGFLYCAFGRDYGLVVTQDASTTISAGIDAGQPWRRCHGNNVSYTDWQRDNFYRTAKQQLANVSGNIGLELDHVSVDNLAKFNAVLPNQAKIDVGRPTMRMRMIKSSEEMAVIREGARIADLGGEAVVDAMHEGATEYEVALAATRVMVREIARRYPNSDIMDTWTWLQSGLNTDGAHNPVTTRAIQKGDILSLNCFPMIQGYYTALERTLFLDNASDASLSHWEANCRVHRRGLELVRPGVRCCDIALELNDLYRQLGRLQYRSFGYGHSFGTLSHYYGREEDLELREDIETVLEPGMVVSMEPMITVPLNQPGAGGYREHDILIVGDQTVENITKFPFGPEKNIIKK